MLLMKSQVQVVQLPLIVVGLLNHTERMPHRSTNTSQNLHITRVLEYSRHVTPGFKKHAVSIEPIPPPIPVVNSNPTVIIVNCCCAVCSVLHHGNDFSNRKALGRFVVNVIHVLLWCVAFPAAYTVFSTFRGVVSRQWKKPCTYMSPTSSLECSSRCFRTVRT